MLFIINFSRFSAAAQNLRMNFDEKAGDRLTVCEEELLYAFARFVSISSNFLLKHSVVYTLIQLQCTKTFHL